MLESAYVDNCNSSVPTLEDLEEVKQKMPGFMSSHGTSNGFINTAGYSWDPESDTMRILTPKIFHGEKKKGRFTQDI